MARGVNKCIFIGNMAADPETKYMPSGGAVVNFSIGVSESWKDKQGEKQERTEWVRASAFGRLAEIIGEYGRKGQQVYIEGRMQTRKYQKEGQDHYTTEIVVNEFQMLGGRSHDAPFEQKGQKQAAPAGDDFDDAIPF